MLVIAQIILLVLQYQHLINVPFFVLWFPTFILGFQLTLFIVLTVLSILFALLEGK